MPTPDSSVGTIASSSQSTPTPFTTGSGSSGPKWYSDDIDWTEVNRSSPTVFPFATCQKLRELGVTRSSLSDEELPRILMSELNRLESSSTSNSGNNKYRGNKEPSSTSGPSSLSQQPQQQMHTLISCRKLVLELKKIYEFNALACYVDWAGLSKVVPDKCVPMRTSSSSSGGSSESQQPHTALATVFERIIDGFARRVTGQTVGLPAVERLVYEIALSPSTGGGTGAGGETADRGLTVATDAVTAVQADARYTDDFPADVTCRAIMCAHELQRKSTAQRKLQQQQQGGGSGQCSLTRDVIFCFVVPKWTERLRPMLTHFRNAGIRTLLAVHYASLPSNTIPEDFALHVGCTRALLFPHDFGPQMRLLITGETANRKDLRLAAIPAASVPMVGAAATSNKIKRGNSNEEEDDDDAYYGYHPPAPSSFLNAAQLAGFAAASATTSPTPTPAGSTTTSAIVAGGGGGATNATTSTGGGEHPSGSYAAAAAAAASAASSSSSSAAAAAGPVSIRKLLPLLECIASHMETSILRDGSVLRSLLGTSIRHFVPKSQIATLPPVRELVADSVEAGLCVPCGGGGAESIKLTARGAKAVQAFSTNSDLVASVASIASGTPSSAAGASSSMTTPSSSTNANSTTTTITNNNNNKDQHQSSSTTSTTEGHGSKALPTYSAALAKKHQQQEDDQGGAATDNKTNTTAAPLNPRQIARIDTSIETVYSQNEELTRSVLRGMLQAMYDVASAHSSTGSPKGRVLCSKLGAKINGLLKPGPKGRMKALCEVLDANKMVKYNPTNGSEGMELTEFGLAVLERMNSKQQAAAAQPHMTRAERRTAEKAERDRIKKEREEAASNNRQQEKTSAAAAAAAAASASAAADQLLPITHSGDDLPTTTGGGFEPGVQLLPGVHMPRSNSTPASAGGVGAGDSPDAFAVSNSKKQVDDDHDDDDDDDDTSGVKNILATLGQQQPPGPSTSAADSDSTSLFGGGGAFGTTTSAVSKGWGAAADDSSASGADDRGSSDSPPMLLFGSGSTLTPSKTAAATSSSSDSIKNKNDTNQEDGSSSSKGENGNGNGHNDHQYLVITFSSNYTPEETETARRVIAMQSVLRNRDPKSGKTGYNVAANCDEPTSCRIGLGPFVAKEKAEAERDWFKEQTWFPSGSAQFVVTDRPQMFRVGSITKPK